MPIEIFFVLMLLAWEKWLAEVCQSCLSDEVDNDQVKNDVSKHEIGERSLWAHVAEGVLVGLVDLDAVASLKSETFWIINWIFRVRMVNDLYD